MGIFSSNEEKEARRQEKAREALAEQQRKEQKLLEKYGLDLNNYDDEDIRKRNNASIRDINTQLAGSGLYSFGNLLPGGNSDASFIIDLLKAQIQQNWILIRQNEQIIRLLSDVDNDDI